MIENTFTQMMAREEIGRGALVPNANETEQQVGLKQAAQMGLWLLPTLL